MKRAACQNLGHACRRSETFFGAERHGYEAKRRNEELALDQWAALARDVLERGRYDRLPRYVYLSDGTWVNGVLVQEGYARVTIYSPDDRYEDRLYRLEEEAKIRNVGGWAGCDW